MARHPNSEARPIGRLDPLIARLFTVSDTPELLHAICSLGVEVAGAVGVAVLARQAGKVSVVASVPALAGDGAPLPEWLTALSRTYGQMLAETAQTAPLTIGGQALFGVYVPLLHNASGSLMLAACVAGGRNARLEGVSDALQLLRACLFFAEQAARPQPEAMAAGDDTLAKVLEVLGQVQGCSRFFEAAATVCSEIAARFCCRRVALGSVSAHAVKVTALEKMDNFEKGTRPVRRMEEAMQEALDQDRSILFSVEAEPDGGVITRAARELALAEHVRTVFCVPLRDAEGIVFVALFLLEDAPGDKEVDALSLLCRLAGPRLIDLKKAEESALRKSWRHIVMRSADIFGPRRTALKLAGAALGFLLLFSLLVPGNIRITSPIVVEGENSYTHTAPMDSYLIRVLARPGDLVRAGDLLGQLEDAEIRMEIEALEAQFHIYQRQRLQYTQEGKDAEAEIARLEAEKTGANLAWAKQRLSMTELRSSTEGYLVSEDMLPRLGQPVRRGQELFEITDISSLRVCVHVDEKDISDVARAMARGRVHGEFTLTAYPDRSIRFALERIHPFSSVEKDSNGFEVQGKLLVRSPELLLRPGMEGVAHIETGQSTLFYVWTRTLINKIRLLWWRWV